MVKCKSRRVLLWIWVSMLTLSAASGFILSKSMGSPLREADAEVISSECKITHIYNYTVCGECETEVSSAKNKLKGMTRDELEDDLISGRITSFSADSVVIRNDIRQYCKDHYILFLEDDELVIRQNIDTDKELEIYEILGEPNSPLKSDMIERLSKGIVFSDESTAKDFAFNDIYN